MYWHNVHVPSYFLLKIPSTKSQFPKKLRKPRSSQTFDEKIRQIKLILYVFLKKTILYFDVVFVRWLLSCHFWQLRTNSEGCWDKRNFFCTLGPKIKGQISHKKKTLSNYVNFWVIWWRNFFKLSLLLKWNFFIFSAFSPKMQLLFKFWPNFVIFSKG